MEIRCKESTGAQVAGLKNIKESHRVFLNSHGDLNCSIPAPKALRLLHDKLTCSSFRKRNLGVMGQDQAPNYSVGDQCYNAVS